MRAKTLAIVAIFAGVVFVPLAYWRANVEAARREAGARNVALASAAARAVGAASWPVTDAGPSDRDLQLAGVPGMAVGFVDGDAIGCEAIGVADVGTGRLANASTVFPAASLAKPIVAITVLRMAEEKKLSLDGEVTSYVEFPVRHPAKGARPITLRMLLTHTGSIHDDFDALMNASAVGAPPLPLGDFLQAYVSRKDAGSWTAFDVALPSTAYAYSNVGYALAALAVESVAREPFERVARRVVFRPLKMNAGFHAPGFAPTDMAQPHVTKAGRFEVAPLRAHSVFPASDLRSDACSYARLAAALMRGGELDGERILAPSSVEELFRATRTGWRELTLGLQQMSILDPPVVGHEGEDIGVSAFFGMARPKRRAAVVLANGDAFSSGDRARVDALAAVVARYMR